MCNSSLIAPKVEARFRDFRRDTSRLQKNSTTASDGSLRKTRCHRRFGVSPRNTTCSRPNDGSMRSSSHRRLADWEDHLRQVAPGRKDLKDRSFLHDSLRGVAELTLYILPIESASKDRQVGPMCPRSGP